MELPLGVTYKPQQGGKYVATWTDSKTKKPKSKSFSINKWKEEAKTLACEYRKKMIESGQAVSKYEKNSFYLKDDYAVIIISSEKYGDMETKIDVEDLDRVLEFGKWSWTRGGKQKDFYVNCRVKSMGLHRFIMNVTDVKEHIDHLNGDTLDNRKSNLRITDVKGNRRNTHFRSDSKTGIVGVNPIKKGDKRGYKATWFTKEGKSCCKEFWFHKHKSEEEAFELAYTYRLLMKEKHGYHLIQEEIDYLNDHRNHFETGA